MPNREAFDALHQANPRRQPAFDDSVASYTSNTRKVLAAALLGTSVGALPTAPGTSTLRRAAGRLKGRGGGLPLPLLGAAGALVIALLLFLTGTIPTNPGDQARSVGSPGATGTGPSQGGGSSNVTATTAVPNAGAPGPLSPSDTAGGVTASTAGPATMTGSSGSSGSSGSTGSTGSTGSSGSNGTAAAGGGAAGHTTSTATAPATTAPTTATTASPPPTSVVLASAPTCSAISAQPAGAPVNQSVSVQAAGSGLASISNIVVSNGTVHVPAFAAGTRAAVIIVATKSDRSLPTFWSFDATDTMGRTTHCV